MTGRTRIRLALAAVLACALGGLGYARFESRQLHAELMELAEAHVAAQRNPGEESAVQVFAARPYAVAGTPIGKIEVYTRPEGATELARVSAVEYHYRREGGTWRLTDSGRCAGADCELRAFRAFGETAPGR